MKKLLILMLLFIFGLFIPFGCTANSPDSANTRNHEKADTVLNIYNWSAYIDEETIPEFEEKFNVKVQYDTYESQEALLAKIQPGNPGYDLIFPGGDYVENMIAQGLLEELNHDNIPNLKHIDDTFIDTVFDPGNKYSIPYQWGTVGIAYDVEETGKEINSWKDIFEPEYQGKVALPDDPRTTLGLTLIYLGYNPNTTDEGEIAKAKDFLIANKDTISTFSFFGQRIILQEGIDISIEDNGDMFDIMEADENIRYVIPQEGTIIWMDNLAIPKDAPHKELAEKFINFILEPEVSARISNYTKFGSPNKTARSEKLLAKEDLENPVIYPPSKYYKLLQYVNDVGSALALYDRAWTEVKVEVGR
ncbi:MAG: spermidine/putrescine ABC transporter substrate-binding protein [Cyanobacteria bacterium SBLK]|nr:spermidine/putrescine ABC transporter substrate-binding protein [Cyanobacteria bacterium SBLK]